MKLLIADDHVLFREALLLFIHSKCPGWTITAVSDTQETIQLLQQPDNRYDLILLDLRMPGMTDMDGLEQILTDYPKQPVAILSGVAEEHHVRQAMKMGVRAYFPKTLSGNALIKAIELVVLSKQRFVPMDDTGLQIMPSYYDDASSCASKKTKVAKIDYRHNILTKRENEVMPYLAKGMTNKEIADELSLKPSTVKIYVAKICKKLGVENRTQAALLYKK